MFKLHAERFTVLYNNKVLYISIAQYLAAACDEIRSGDELDGVAQRSLARDHRKHVQRALIHLHVFLLAATRLQQTR